MLPRACVPRVFIPRVLSFKGPMFHRSYIPRVLCSQGPMFNRFYRFPGFSLEVGIQDPLSCKCYVPYKTVERGTMEIQDMTSMLT